MRLVNNSTCIRLGIWYTSECSVRPSVSPKRRGRESDTLHGTWNTNRETERWCGCHTCDYILLPLSSGYRLFVVSSPAHSPLDLIVLYDLGAIFRTHPLAFPCLLPLEPISCFAGSMLRKASPAASHTALSLIIHFIHAAPSASSFLPRVFSRMRVSREWTEKRKTNCKFHNCSHHRKTNALNVILMSCQSSYIMWRKASLLSLFSFTWTKKPYKNQCGNHSTYGTTGVGQWKSVISPSHVWIQVSHTSCNFPLVNILSSSFLSVFSSKPFPFWFPIKQMSVIIPKYDGEDGVTMYSHSGVEKEDEKKSSFCTNATLFYAPFH